LVCATPAAGKTRLALYLAKQALDDGVVGRIAVAASTDPLRQQWAEEAAVAGIDLMPVAVPADYDKAGYQGCVVTYQQLATGAGADMMRAALHVPTFVILDEIHHAGKERAWGAALERAFEPAVHRLALTGTPWRREGSSPIPFVTYDKVTDKVKPDSTYEYGAAVADGVCRPIEFHAYDGDAKWVDCGKIVESTLGNKLSDADLAMALDAALDPKNQWMPGLLREAVASLEELRQEVPDAGGLVVAYSVAHAYAYAVILEALTGEAPIVAVSEDDDAKDKIAQFRKGRQRWLVAVKMVSEGVDIKRLAIGVYATKAKTPLFFRQVVGRFVRTRPGEEINARLFIPAVPALTVHAREIEEELRHQLELQRQVDERSNKTDRSPSEMPDRETLSASAPTFSGSIFAGEEISPEVYILAEQWCRERGIPAMYAANVVDMVSATTGMESGAPPVPEPESRLQRERLLRAEAKALVPKVANRFGIEYKEVNTRLLRPVKFGGAGVPPRAAASVEELEHTVAVLEAWLCKDYWA
jgi:superfamily II DNA or RNA helicase